LPLSSAAAPSPRPACAGPAALDSSTRTAAEGSRFAIAECFIALLPDYKCNLRGAGGSGSYDEYSRSCVALSFVVGDSLTQRGPAGCATMNALSGSADNGPTGRTSCCALCPSFAAGRDHTLAVTDYCNPSGVVKSLRAEYLVEETHWRAADRLLPDRAPDLGIQRI
jgi:hypothetical protein